MLRSSCGMFSSETCLMATKSPFSRSSPLYTRPYAPFPISSPSICTRARAGAVSESRITPKFAATEHEFRPDLRREARESSRICCRASWICGTAHCAASTPYRRLLRDRAPGAAGDGGSAVTGGGAESLASSWRGPFSLALGFGWGGNWRTGASRKTKAGGEKRKRERLEAGLFCNSYYFPSSFRYFFWAWETNGMDPLLYRGVGP